MTKSAHKTLARASLDLARRFGVGGQQWTITRPNTSGTADTIGTAPFLFVRQRRLSRLSLALSGSAASLRAEWAAYWDAAMTPAPVAGDTITSAIDSTLAFLVTSLSTTDRPSAIVATLEKQPYV